MIVLDTDVAIDLLRGVPAAVAWFSTLSENVRWLTRCRIVWLAAQSSESAYRKLIHVHVGNAVGVLDVLIGQVAIALQLPLHTFNQKHFDAIAELRTVRPNTH